MNTLAQIENGVVVQVIVASSVTWAEQQLGGVWVQCENVGIGWVWDGENFIPQESGEKNLD